MESEPSRQSEGNGERSPEDQPQQARGDPRAQQGDSPPPILLQQQQADRGDRGQERRLEGCENGKEIVDAPHARGSVDRHAHQERIPRRVPARRNHRRCCR